MKISVVFRAFRPSFLILTPVCILLGISTSLAIQSPIDLVMVSLIFVGAVFAHISVNTLNEYYDFKSGLDFKTNKTPFSGGSGALPDNPELAKAVLVIGWLSLMLTVLVGIYLLSERGIQVMPIGIIGIAVIITYTQWLNRYPLLCLIAPGLGFGLLMVVGTHVVLTGEYSQLTWLGSLVPFFLVNNLLLLNQYPDMEADKSVGRKTFPIVFGLNKSNLVYTMFMLAAYLMIVGLIIMGAIPYLSFIALTPMIFSLFALYGAIKYSARIGEFPHYLGANVAATILTPLLLAVSIL